MDLNESLEERIGDTVKKIDEWHAQPRGECDRSKAAWHEENILELIELVNTIRENSESERDRSRLTKLRSAMRELEQLFEEIQVTASLDNIDVKFLRVGLNCSRLMMHTNIVTQPVCKTAPVEPFDQKSIALSLVKDQTTRIQEGFAEWKKSQPDEHDALLLIRMIKTCISLLDLAFDDDESSRRMMEKIVAGMTEVRRALNKVPLSSDPILIENAEFEWERVVSLLAMAETGEQERSEQAEILS